MGSRTLALGLQVFGVVAVAVTAAVLAPLLLTGPPRTEGPETSPPLSSKEVARVLGVEPSPRPKPASGRPDHGPTERLVAVGEPAIPAAREALTLKIDSSRLRVVRPAELVRLPKPADEPQRSSPPGRTQSSSSKPSHAQGPKVRSHSSNGHGHAYGHDKRAGKGKKRR